jgi:hypothetical protein
MKKKFYDIIPQEKRSIRNIPITKSNTHSDPTVDQPHLEEGSIEPKDQPRDYIIEPAFETNAIEHHKKDIENFSGNIHEEPRVKTSSSKTSKNMDGIKMPISSHTAHESEAFGHIQTSRLSNDNFEKSDSDGNDVETEGDDNLEDSDGDVQGFDEWKKNHKGNGVRNTFIFVTLAIVAAILMSTTFASAKINIVPTTKEVVVNDTKILLSQVEHRVIDLESKKEASLESNGLTKVNRKASGTVVLYNDFNTSDQALVANTRLETSDGLIFFLKERVTIPGRKTVGGKSVPGSVTANIEASEAGEKYNVGLKDFKLVAYRGTDRYNKIYGRSKTSIGNGFVGEVPNIPQSSIASTTDSLKATILSDLREKAADKADSGDGEVFIDSMILVEYSTPKQSASKDGKKVTIEIEAKAKAILVKKNSLADFLNKSQDSSAGSDKSTTTVPSLISYTGNADLLTFRFPVDVKLTDLSRDTAYVVASGTSTITSVVDNEKVARAVSGLTREQAIPAIKAIVDLETLEVSLRPWWRSKLPRANKIEIKIEG